MPVELEKKLRREAKKKGLSGERADSYVFGTMRKTNEARTTRKKGR